jgi:hypothetical protein
MFARLPWLMLACLVFAGCSKNLRARYSFVPHEAYRVDPSVEASEDTPPDKLLVRCTEDETPMKCAFEDQDVVVDLELVNRAPLLTIANETDQPIIVYWSGAHFELPDGSQTPLELVVTSHRPPTATEIEPHKYFETRVHPLDQWEERCSDVADYEGPTREGKGYVIGTYWPAETKRDGDRLAGCRMYPKAMVMESIKQTRERRKKPLSADKQRELFNMQIGKEIRIVLPVEVEGRALQYVLAYAVAEADIR